MAPGRKGKRNQKRRARKKQKSGVIKLPKKVKLDPEHVKK